MVRAESCFDISRLSPGRASKAGFVGKDPSTNQELVWYLSPIDLRLTLGQDRDLGTSPINLVPKHLRTPESHDSP
jgi:hypothetical protein